MSHWSVAIKDGTRKTEYTIKHCRVCKAAVSELVEDCDHECLYCVECFDESGYKKDCILKEDCKKHGRMMIGRKLGGP